MKRTFYIIIFMLVFLLFSGYITGYSDTKSAALRIVIWDLTENNPIHTKAEVWIRGFGSLYLKKVLSGEKSAKKCGEYPVGAKQEFIFYPESRKGRELTVPFMMTKDMNPNGSARDALRISFYDKEIEFSGPPIKAATGKSEMKFKRK